MSTWTPERIELLKKLSAEGQAARAIALALGGGFTRNAVIGKLHRVSTDERSTTYGYGPHRRKPASERKAGEGQGRLGHGPQLGEVRRSEDGRTKPPVPLPPEPPVPSEAKMLSLMELGKPDLQMADRGSGSRRVRLLRGGQAGRAGRLLRVSRAARLCVAGGVA